MKFESIAAGAAIANRIKPDGNCGVVPPAMIYNAVTNLQGALARSMTTTVNVYAGTPARFCGGPLDNEGIQYGLKVLNSGVIAVEQFLNLNEKIGGLTSSQPCAARMQAI